MKLHDLHDAWQANTLTKHEYIEAMYGLHSQLFDYANYLKATAISKLIISDGLVVAEARESGLRFACMPGDWRTAPIETLNFGSYEAQDAAMLMRLVQPGMIVFDIGANIGWYTLHFAHQYLNVQVHAFEPVPTTFAWLQKNIALNTIQNIFAYNFGFSDYEAELMFYLQEGFSVSASAANLSDRQNVPNVRVRVVRFDDFASANHLHVDLIKCDVEGAELSVFRGAEQTLRQHRPIIFTEMLRKWAAKFGYHPNDMIAFMAGLGYTCHIIFQNRLRRCSYVDETTTETNYVFLHLEQHAQIISSFVSEH